MMSRKRRRVLTLLFIAVLAFFMGQWSVMLFNIKSAEDTSTADPVVEVQVEKPTLLEQIKAKKELEVVIVNGPTTYFVGPIGKEGFEYILLSKYAKHLGVALKLDVVSTVNEALALTREGVGDITSGALSRTKEREEIFLFGPSYFSVKEEVVCHQKMIRDGSFPRSLEDLVGLKIVVGEDTSYAEHLVAFQQELPELVFEESAEFSSEQLLGLVSQGKIDCSVVDSNIFAVNNRYYPAIRKSFDISGLKELSWILREGEEALGEDMRRWLNEYKNSGEMARLIDHYYSYTDSFNYVNLTAFHKRLKTRLPKYKETFVKAAQKYDIPWTLLTAQSYQESHWDRLAKSPTGVRGMMMLTLPTAKEMGVKYRLNAAQSIYGGAKYFAKMLKDVAPDVKGVDRYKFAYAAYNVGMGHLIDARVLARKQGKNPNRWKDIKTVLPLLSQRKYYKDLKYGYARGQEPVAYVEAIYEYHVILENKYKNKANYEK
ncbi:MAG: membrane-bound lytic murein transglycosylase MltF [Helicobacteraceae bacterium]|jgi:membrane-bound lytic murein transglycosylase F|nr:membrane-bound lytic murein transglycosylase MltF [Helicobacteraceae bacterium]